MLYEWIKNIVVFTIFFSFILFMVPDEKYKKYIKNAIGFTMILVVIKPVLKLADINEIPDFNYYYNASEYSLIDSDRSYYGDIMSNIVGAYIQDSYGIECQVDIIWNENNEIEKLDIYNLQYGYPEYNYSNSNNNEDVTEEITQEIIHNIKEDIAYRYDVDIDRINVS